MVLVLSLQKSGITFWHSLQCTLAWAWIRTTLRLFGGCLLIKRGCGAAARCWEGLFPVHWSALTEFITSFAVPLQGWVGWTQHRFFQQQGRDMLRSRHAVKINHSLLWIHYANFIRHRNIPPLLLPVLLHPNCARNSPRYVIMWKYYATRAFEKHNSLCFAVVERFLQSI